MLYLAIRNTAWARVLVIYKHISLRKIYILCLYSIFAQGNINNISYCDIISYVHIMTQTSYDIRNFYIVAALQFI